MQCELSALEADINKLASLVSQSSVSSSTKAGDVETDEILAVESAAEGDLAELLAKLNGAEGLAGEVEGKLDELLNKLDGMLGQLEDSDKGDEAGKGTG